METVSKPPQPGTICPVDHVFNYFRLMQSLSELFLTQLLQNAGSDAVVGSIVRH